MKTADSLVAVEHVRQMRGGAQAHLMRASDSNFYVVKFANNPQHIRVLANELFGTLIAQALGLPVPEISPIEVPDSLITYSPDLHIEIGGIHTKCSSGLQLAIRYVADPGQHHVFDYLPESMMQKIRNRQDFSRILVFDKWTGNSDGRQAVFWKKAQKRKYNVTFIDQGYCFNAGEWDFPDSPLRGVYARYAVYSDVTGWESFEPTLSRVKQFDPASLWKLANQIPKEWYESDSQGLSRLIETLQERRSSVRDLLTSFRASPRNPFPNWKK